MDASVPEAPGHRPEMCRMAFLRFLPRCFLQGRDETELYREQEGMQAFLQKRFPLRGQAPAEQGPAYSPRKIPLSLSGSVPGETAFLETALLGSGESLHTAFPASVSCFPYRAAFPVSAAVFWSNGNTPIPLLLIYVKSPEKVPLLFSQLQDSTFYL